MISLLEDVYNNVSGKYFWKLILIEKKIAKSDTPTLNFGDTPNLILMQDCIIHSCCLVKGSSGIKQVKTTQK